MERRPRQRPALRRRRRRRPPRGQRLLHRRAGRRRHPRRRRRRHRPGRRRQRRPLRRGGRRPAAAISSRTKRGTAPGPRRLLALGARHRRHACPAMRHHRRRGASDVCPAMAKRARPGGFSALRSPRSGLTTGVGTCRCRCESHAFPGRCPTARSWPSLRSCMAGQFHDPPAIIKYVGAGSTCDVILRQYGPECAGYGQAFKATNPPSPDAWRHHHQAHNPCCPPFEVNKLYPAAAGTRNQALDCLATRRRCEGRGDRTTRRLWRQRGAAP